MKNKGGRPRKLTREIKDALIDGVSRGLTLKAACKCAGISYSSLANWKKLARGGDQDADVYTDFIANINAAIRYAQYQQRQQALALIKKEDFKFKKRKKNIRLTPKEMEANLIAHLVAQVEALEKKESKKG